MSTCSGSNHDAARAQLGDDAAPVRIRAVERALHELAGGHGARGATGLVGRPGALDDDGRELGRPFRIRCHRECEVVADLRDRLDERVVRVALTPDRVVARDTVREQQHRVVGAARAVDDQGIERVAHGMLEGSVQRGWCRRCVGDDDGEHRGHRRGQHRGALRHAADAERRAARELGDGERLLAHRVRGEHRVGGGVPGFVIGSELTDELRDALLDRFHRQRDADQARRAHQDIGGCPAERHRDELARAPCRGASGLPRRRVGVPGVDDHRVGPAVVQVLPGDLDRCGTHEVGGEHAGRGDRLTIGGRDEREVGLAGWLDARREPGGLEAGDADDAHGISPSAGRPVGSGRPRTRLSAWIPWPAAPFTRLSIAAIASTESVRAS